jgi:hypothetical protein
MVHAFDIDGQSVWNTGGMGDGPEEFRSPSRVSVVDDTSVVIWDSPRRRMTVLDSRDGSLIDSHPRQPDLGYLSELLGVVVADTTWFVFEERLRETADDEMPATPSEVFRPSERVVAWSPAADSAKVIPVRGPESVAGRSRDGRVFGAKAIVFGNLSSATVSGDAIVIGDSESLSFRRFSPQSWGFQVQYSVFADTVSRPRFREFTDSIRDELEEAVREGGAVGRLAEVEIELLDAMPVRTELPRLRRILGAGDGTIWVERYPYPSSTTSQWTVLSERWRPTATVEIPSELRVLDVLGERLLTLRVDTLGRHIVDVWQMQSS